MTTQLSITIGIIAVAVLLVIAVFLFIIMFNNDEKKDKRFRKKSEEIRSKVEKQVEEIRSRINEENINLETEAGEKLKASLRECDYLVRDGYRSTDKIEKVSAQLPALEEAARAASK